MSNSQSKNAFTHGYYVSDIVLPKESQQDFEALLKAYRDEYCPDGVSEEAAVFDLTSLHWRKRRFDVGSRQALQKQQDYSAAADTKTDAWDILADAARAAGKSQTEAAQLVCKLLAKYTEEVCNADGASDDGQSVQFEKLTVLAKELNLLSKDLVVPLLHAAEKQKLDQIERAYQPDITERELKIQAEFGRQIEKTMKRLVLLKECKKYYCAKPTNAKQIEST